MLLSRFWYVTLSLLLGAAVFVLYLAMSMYNRAGDRTMSEALNSDSQVVAWYLRGDARDRAAQLIRFAVDQDLAKNLQKSSDSDKKIPDDAQDAVARALAKINGTIPKAEAFDAVFAVDQHGRVVAHMGYEQVRAMGHFELGGYPVVADALHGYIRDDTLVLDRIYRVVARPIEFELGQMPAGAIVGARIVDDRFARELSARTGAVIAFHSKGARVATGAPEGFDVSQLDQMFGDMARLGADKEYQEKGRSRVRMLSSQIGVQYSRLPGEAWQLGAGYAVGRQRNAVDSPLGFFSQSDDVDKEHANLRLAIMVAVAAALVGLLLSIVEHTRPLRQFRSEALKLAQGQLDQLQPSRFRGICRKIASDLNDGIEVVAAKGGVPRRAADFKQVLGDIPDQPMMSAFAFPDEGPSPASAAARPPLDSAPQASMPRRPPPGPASAGRPAPGPAAVAAPGQNPEWIRVFEDFVAKKRECGEDLQGFTYEKFEKTLRKNQEAILERHGAARVRFSVYVKAGKAALKASPIRD
ncbi:MAG: hypothetical protein JW940_08585 [Polyangiaceae bacterium]|nr:hypothetical protein [Polyangiaceae bacterium]